MIIYNFYRRYYRNRAAWALNMSRKIKIMTRFIIVSLFFLFIFLISILPLAIKTLIALLILFPYIKIVTVKTRLTFRFYKKIKSNQFIGIDSIDMDLRARKKLLGKSITLCISYLIILMAVMNWFWGNKSLTNNLGNWLTGDIVFAGWLGFIFYAYIFLITMRRRWLVLFLSLTSPFITLSLIMFVLHTISKLLLNVKGIDYSTLMNGFFDSYIYMFIASGVDEGFAVYNFAYSFAFQLLFVTIQPVYKIEKCKLALETIAVLFGVLSAIGLLMATPVSEFLYEYMKNSNDEIGGYMYYLEYKNNGVFMQFYEQALKFVILPFSLGIMIPILILKYREASSKSKGQRAFDFACKYPDLPTSEMLPILREALYFGGSTIRGAIQGHYQLHVYVPFLNVNRTIQVGWKRRIRNNIIMRFHRFINKIRNFPTYTISMLALLSEMLCAEWRNFRLDFSHALNVRFFWIKMLSSLLIMLALFWSLFSGAAVALFSKLYEYYLVLYGNDEIRANASFVVLYLLLVSFYFFRRAILIRHKPKILRTELRKLYLHIFLLVFTAVIVFFTNLIYMSWISATIFIFIWHSTWLLDQKNNFMRHSNVDDVA